LRRLCVVLGWTAILLSVLSVGRAMVMTVSNPAPGNLFVAGQPVVVILADVSGGVAYELEDYFGEQVAGSNEQKRANAARMLGKLLAAPYLYFGDDEAAA